MTLLQLEDVGKSFGGLAAVSGLSFNIPTGCVLGLLGPNGAGKTTLINLITGLQPASTGVIRLDGQPIQHRPAFEIAAAGIARTYQNVRLFSGMTVLEQVVAGCFIRRGTSFAASVLGLPSARAARRHTLAEARHLLDRVGMADRADILAETLSYGEQRRIEIARALGSHPRLLLLDEPTAGMNPAESAEIGILVHALRDTGLTVMLVEHNIRLVTRFCDRAVVMNFGRLIAEGTPEYCIADPDVQTAYFGRRAHA